MSVERPFIPGRELSRAFFEEIVSPIVGSAFSRLTYAAGLLGPGSDVLGYDTARSMDHDWGPRCTLVLSAEDEWCVGARLRDALADSLPTAFRDHPVMFQAAPGEPNVSIPAVPGHNLPPFHRVEITTLQSFLARLDLDQRSEPDEAFWLTVTEQQLLECTSGLVFRDDDGELTRARGRLSYYPDDVWRYRMAAMWMRISQIEPFVGRTGELGDAVGSFVIGARLAEDIMRLAFFQARQYAPYSKWLGTAFSRIEGVRDLHSCLEATRMAATWKEREAAIVAAASLLVRAHNRLGITPPLDPAPRPFHTRPFMVIDAKRVSDALMATLGDSALSRLPAGLGGIDQFMDSADALGDRWLRQSLRAAMRQIMRHNG